ncbi:ThiF family adenylyltransferase, partial [Staphylococcus pseudintermedius]|nr:ThiF family adenylyltransferase [Staphylococcus pseudintermedius]
MRFKEDVLLYRDKEKTIIKKGIYKYIIEDKDGDIYKVLIKNKFDKETTPKEQFEFLESNNLICDNYKNVFENTKNEKNISFFECYFNNISPLDVQKIIQEKNVAIIGMGGIGTVVLDSLQRMGFKNFVIIDYDNVEISNLNRQILFNEYSIGQPKTLIAKNNTFKNINIVCINKKIDSYEKINSNIIKKTDFIINCADTPNNIIEIINDFAVKESIPFITGHVGIETGTWGPIYDHRLKNFKKTPVIDVPMKLIKGSISATNAIIGNFIALDTMVYLSEEKRGNNTLLYKE